MFAWVTIDRQHRPYLSPIFARAIHKGDWDEYERAYHTFCVVLNESKDKLINVDLYQNTDENIEVHVVVIDNDMDNWLPKNQYYGSMDFLAKYDPEELNKQISSEDLKKCIEIANSFNYQEVVEVKSKQGIDNLMEAGFGFHDAHINKINSDKDEISILFDRSWGSQIKLWFKGDTDYQISADESNDNYWYDLSVFFRENYVYLCDEEDIDFHKGDGVSTFFRGRKLYYRVTPACYDDDADGNKLLNIGAEAYRNGDYRKAQSYYEKAADLGNDQAACNLGYIYEYGRTGEKNPQKAFDWFKKSADQDNANAAYKVGDAYFYGDGVERNDGSAFHYYIKASNIAKKSDGRDDDIKSDIYYRIALCLHTGRGVKLNDLWALKYVNDAEFYSYCDRFEDKFMWQSTAKRIEKLRSEILANLQQF